MIRRILIAAAMLAFAPSCAFASNLLNAAFTTAQSAALSSVLQFRDSGRESVELQATFTYGSAGTSADAWVQTSVDGGATWTDVAEFRFTTASARFEFNLSSLTPSTTEVIPTDGAMTANTSLDGVLGPMWRVKWTSVGTYAGNTNLRVDLMANRGRLAP
jgi:hypothetical protein